MALRFEEIRSLLDQNLGENELILRLRSGNEAGNWTEAWRRCALLRHFDEEAFGKAMTGVDTPPKFAEFAKAPEVERVGSEGKRFAVRSAKRAEVLPAWQRDAALRPFATQMAEYYQSRKDELSLLAMESLVKPEAAGPHFEALYAKADESFDVPACSQLIEILRARYELIDERLQELWRSYDVYLRGRTLFADDYYRSASYLERASLAEALDGFLKDKNRWLLRLFGKGGSGKTMFVRWLVARRCLPRVQGRDPIAVARIDFDAFSLNSFAARPWLTLLHIARQLSPQLPDNPFQEMIDGRADFLPILVRNESPGESMAALMEVEKSSIIRSFYAGIRDRSVLIVLDTCEDPLIHRQAAFLSLLNLLVEARRTGRSNLRVIASGRYDICEKGRLPEFESESLAVKVEPFNGEEAKIYLIEKRGMKPGELVDAIAERSAGNPFSLGLFAELALSPGFGVQQVKEAPQDDFIYLLDRVILRIPAGQEPVRWLVRYAVIPRELTLDFALKVLTPFFDDQSRDKANDFEGNLEKRYGSKKPWPESKIGDLKEIWDQLRQYASNPSWIVWNEQMSSLKLQSEVVVPMRKLLQKDESLYNRLEQVAEKYWRDQAEAHPEEFGRYMAEAMFQRFQRIGPRAAGEWRQLVDDPRVRTASDRMHLGEVLLDNSFLDDASQPRRHVKGKLVVPLKAVMEARFVVAMCALTERLTMNRPWETGELASDKFGEQWEHLRDASEIPRPLSTLLRTAGDYVLSGRLPAPESLRKIDGPENPLAAFPEYLQLLWYVLAGRIAADVAASGEKTSAGAFAAARRISKSSRSHDFPLHRIRYQEGMYYFRCGKLPQAAGAFEKALDGMLRNDPLSSDREECFWRLMWVLRLTGRWNDALAITKHFEEVLSKVDPAFQNLMFQCNYARCLIALDLGEFRASFEYFHSTQTSTDSPALAPLAHELAGEWGLRSLNMSVAEPELAVALQLYGGPYPAAERIRVLQAAVLVAKGNLIGARQRFELSPSRAWQITLEKEAVRILAGNPSDDVPPGPAEVRARVCALALAVGTEHSPAEFLTEFAKLKSDESKYASLIPFGETEAIRPRNEKSNVRARKLFPKRPVRDGNAAFAIQSLALANAYRYFGDLVGAKQILGRFPRQKHPLVEWKRLRALDAVGHERAADAASLLTAIRREFPEVPLMRVAVALDVAEWYLGSSNPKDTSDVLNIARRDLSLSGIPGSLWHARLSLLEGRVAEANWQEDAAARSYQEAASAASDAGAEKLKQTADLALQALQKKGVTAKSERPLIRTMDTWWFAITERGELEVRFDLTGRGGGRFVNDTPSWLNAGTLPSITDWPSSMKQLAKAAVPFEDRFWPAANRCCPSGVLATLPWELLAPKEAEFFYRCGGSSTPNRATVVWLQRALRLLGGTMPVTGERSPQLFAELTRFGGATPHEALRQALLSKHVDPMTPLILGVEPDKRWQQNRKRGYALQSMSLREAYSRLDKYRDVEMMGPWNETPSVIHLVGTFLQHSRGPITFDYGGPTVSSSAHGATATLNVQLFESLLQKWPRDTVRPLIIMDAIYTNDDEAPRQAVSRNEFCSMLFDSGFARAVLGFGLARPRRARATLEMLSNGFAKRRTIGEIHRTLLGERESFFTPPALWTDDPDLPAFQV